MIQVEEIPLNPNGKVDRKRLLDITQTDYVSIPYLAPRNEIEQKLVRAWEKLWRSRESVFMIIFALKGESIKALQVINLLRKDGLKISTTDFLSTPQSLN